MRFRPRSLRVRVLGVLGLVAASPILFVWLSNVWDADAGQRLRHQTIRTARQVARLLTANDPLGAAEKVQQAGVWLRVLAPNGSTIESLDQESVDSITARVGALFFGPDGAPTLAEVDATRPSLAERSVIVQARKNGTSVYCDRSLHGRLAVCQAAVRLENGQIVHIADSSRRVIRALYDMRYQLLKLVIIVGLTAMMLGVWLSWRIIRPIDKLTAQVKVRTNATRPSTSPIDLDRDDEFGDLARAFNRLLAVLDGREQANEAFIADLVHELKNPIAAIQACAESLSAGQGIDGTRATRIARILSTSTGKLDRVVTELLDLARAEAGLKNAKREPVDINTMLAALVDTLRQDPRFEDRSFTIKGHSALIHAQPEGLETALGNLLENAAIHAGKGGQVTVTLTNNQVVISDSGPGIAPDDLSRVFDRFFTTRAKGTGLGLALARALIEADGGAVTAASPPGSGAEFTLTLAGG